MHGAPELVPRTRGQSLEGPSGHRACPHPTALSRAPLGGRVPQAPGHRAAASTCQPWLSQQCPHAVVAEPLKDSCAYFLGHVCSVTLGGRFVRKRPGSFTSVTLTGGVRARPATVYTRTHCPWLVGTKGRHLSPAGWKVSAEVSSRVAVGVSGRPSHRAGFYCPVSFLIRTCRVKPTPSELSHSPGGEHFTPTALLTFRLLKPPWQAHGEGQPGGMGPGKLTGRARQGTWDRDLVRPSFKLLWSRLMLFNQLSSLPQNKDMLQVACPHQTSCPGECGPRLPGPQVHPRNEWVPGQHPLCSSSPARPQPWPAAVSTPPSPAPISVFACLDPLRCGHQTHSSVLEARTPASACTVPTPGRRSAHCRPLQHYLCLTCPGDGRAVSPMLQRPPTWLADCPPCQGLSVPRASWPPPSGPPSPTRCCSCPGGTVSQLEEQTAPTPFDLQGLGLCPPRGPG
ncbi:uncharacterized protein LOC120600163 [Pteropus medius]|uniref:uncharacterized protein LOC120600163 n=1 Tax=Pteropus vampyrus TaxID=132908 RepID=UPI00196A8901|nr:uncharacterized protein LOC120600163 [Pteropus giganteus]